MKAQFETFKSGLAKFALEYQKEFSQNPALRTHFTKMCTKIGVDPLVCTNLLHLFLHLFILFFSASKGFWTEMLGIGDFYYELAVQIVEICFSMRAETGGLLEMNFLISKLKKMRGNQSEITEEDVERSIKTLEPLGSGYEIIKLNTQTFVQSVPRELSQDQSNLLRKASERGGRVNYDGFSTSWTRERFENTVNALLADGLIWVDSKTRNMLPDYWIASFSVSL